MTGRTIKGIERNKHPWRRWTRDEVAEAAIAARDTVVDCAGCGRPMRHGGLYCAGCAARNR